MIHLCGRIRGYVSQNRKRSEVAQYKNKLTKMPPVYIKVKNEKR
jgi:hypothetical protein